jgi:DNA polymerase III sliding clamp (beta) subunit (PCNA family)
VLTVAHVEGRFPDVRFLAKQQRSLLQVAVDGRLLGELLQVAAAFAPEGSQQVVLHYQGAGKPLLLTAGPNDQGQRFQGAMMPLT